MKKLSKRVTIITNVILCITLLGVYTISIFPQNALPTYGNGQITAIYSGDRQSNYVSLMFNVYENTDIVNSIIDVLNDKQVKATFFVGGCWADDNERTLLNIVSNGHEIANHGYFHKDHKKLDYESNYKEIDSADKIIESLSKVKPKLFAPPSGSFSPTTLQASFDLDYKLIMWSKDTIDWRDNDISLIFNRATKNVSGGDLVLMHPKKHTLQVLPTIIDYYKSVGLDVCTVSQNIG
ncbi:MAG: DUF2334 domain-containing protein [Clostridiales bacterium]|nr:DUF2334 domain-containing protein [Clostridiales bacterium]